MISLSLLFTCPVTGDDISAYVYEPIERMIGATVTLRCEDAARQTAMRFLN